MDLTPGQRKAIFAGIVLALAALGAFLLIPGLLLGNGRPAAASQTLHGTAPATVAPTPAGLGASTPPAGTGVDIYQWLPFSQTGLAAAAQVAEQFAADYSSYT